MSKALTIADALAARLNGLSALSGVETFVDRQKDVAVEVAKRVGKATGGCVTILFEGFTNSDPRQSGLPSVTRRYTATVYSRPVLLTAGELPADDIVEGISTALHDWDPDETVAGILQIHVTGGDFRPDFKYLIYDVTIEVKCRL